jgi:hypothetical protein
MNQFIDNVANTLDLGALEQDSLSKEDKFVRDHVDAISPEDYEDDPYGQVSFRSELDGLLKPKVWKSIEEYLMLS